MKHNISRFGPVFIISAALLWSFDGILRRSLYALPPAVVVFYEHLLGFIVLLIFSSYWLPDIKKFTKNEWLAACVVALFSGALGTMLYTGALGKVNYIPFSVVVLLQQLQPIWAIAAASILLKEKMHKSFLGWAALAMVAAYAISFKDLTVNLQTGDGTEIAALMALGAGFMWGSSTAVSKYFLKNISFISGTALRFGLTPLFALLFVFVTGTTSSLTQLTVEEWQALGVIVFSTGLVALGLYYYGLKIVPARHSTLYELVWPASAVFIDYFYFGNALSYSQLAGVGLLLIVIYRVSKLSENAS